MNILSHELVWDIFIADQNNIRYKIRKIYHEVPDQLELIGPSECCPAYIIKIIIRNGTYFINYVIPGNTYNTCPSCENRSKKYIAANKEIYSRCFSSSCLVSAPRNLYPSI